MKYKFRMTIVCLLALIALAGCKKGEPVLPVAPAKYGVVNVEEVLKAHKDWKRLEQLDKRLEALKTDMGESGSSLESLGAKQADRMKKAQQQAEAELQAQLASVKASLEAHRADVARKIAQEAALARTRMQKLSQDQGSVRTVRSKAELGRDLVALRDRQIAAKRLELQKAAKERMESLKTKLDSELSAYERQIASENQQQRVNIQLKMQLEIPEEEKKKLSDEIAAITNEESRLKEKKRAENNNLIDKKGAEELAAVDREVTAYRSKVDADIKAQLGLSSSSNYSKAEIQKKSEQIVSDFNRKQKELESSLHGASASSEAAMAQKQAQLQQRLSDLRKGMIKEMTQSREKLMKSDMERVSKLQEQYSAQEKQRMNLYTAMLEDIKAEVLKINNKENFTAVFLAYVANVTAEDLTQKTIKSLQLAQGVSEGGIDK